MADEKNLLWNQINEFFFHRGFYFNFFLIIRSEFCMVLIQIEKYTRKGGEGGVKISEANTMLFYLFIEFEKRIGVILMERRWLK